MTVTEIVKDCIREGEFILSSGENSTWLCDLLQGIDDLVEIHLNYHIPLYGGIGIGIELGGALIAYKCFTSHGMIRKDETIYLPNTYKSAPSIILLDDVVTTEKTMRKAESVFKEQGIPISSRWCVLDRREPSARDSYVINSLVKWEEIRSSRL